MKNLNSVLLDGKLMKLKMINELIWLTKLNKFHQSHLIYSFSNKYAIFDSLLKFSIKDWSVPHIKIKVVSFVFNNIIFVWKN